MRWTKHCACHAFLPLERMINYNFIKHGSVQSYDTTITFNSLRRQRESAHELREGMGEVMHQQKTWPTDSDVHWLHHPLLWREKKKWQNSKNQANKTKQNLSA